MDVGPGAQQDLNDVSPAADDGEMEGCEPMAIGLVNHISIHQECQARRSAFPRHSVNEGVPIPGIA